MVCDIASCTRQLISYAHKELTGTCLYDHNMYFIQLAGAALRKGRHMKIPKYSLVKDTLKAEITTGNFSVGQKFYTEAELIHKFNVSSITVVRALSDLVREGYLVRHQGRGTFISQAPQRKNEKLVRIINQSIVNEIAAVVYVQRNSNHKILSELDLNDDNYCIAIARTHSVNDMTFEYQENYLVKELIDEHSDKNKYTQLYDYISANKRICLRDEPYEQSICIEVPAEKHVADILGLHEGEVCVKQIRKTSSSITGKPLEYSLSFIRCEFFKVSITNR